jgi:hypothetical protein
MSLTILNESLWPCEPSVDSCHVQWTFAIFTLKNEGRRNNGPQEPVTCQSETSPWIQLSVCRKYQFHFFKKKIWSVVTKTKIILKEKDKTCMTSQVTT